jgi:hypothetical protein
VKRQKLKFMKLNGAGRRGERGKEVKCAVDIHGGLLSCLCILFQRKLPKAWGRPTKKKQAEQLSLTAQGWLGLFVCPPTRVERPCKICSIWFSKALALGVDQFSLSLQDVLYTSYRSLEVSFDNIHLISSNLTACQSKI